MAFSFLQLGRALRSVFVPTVSIICFSSLLSFVFILYQPTPGPGNIQRVGWQAWDIVREGAYGASTNKPVGAADATSKPTIPEGVDWWDVLGKGDNVDAASLPLDVWDPVMQHDTGLSELHITECLFDPLLLPIIGGDFCAPASTKQEDASRGKWVRVDRNMYKQIGMKTLNVYYRRTRRHDVPLITEVRVLPDKETPSPFDKYWHKVDHQINPRGEKRFLWYKAEKTWREMTDAQHKNDLITELDVIFGEDVPWYGFERVDKAAFDGSDKLESVWLTYRKGVKPPPRAPPLHFTKDGRFKIMQIADLHYSVGAGACRDTVDKTCVGGSDNITNSLLGRLLDLEKPNMVVFTGDQLNGQGTSWDARSVLAKFARAVTDRGIPWAAVFGNHDGEDGESRASMLRYMQALPYSLVQRGPEDIHGVGNYVLKVKSADPSMTHLLTLYFLDSGAYSSGVTDFGGLFHPTELDYIRQDQIDWFLQESSEISPIERPFTPDGAKDLGGVWKRQEQLVPGGRKLAKPNALMFFHIPLQEAYGKPDINAKTGMVLMAGLQGLEKEGASKKQEGFFRNGLLQALESDHRADGRIPEVKVVANGHCHITESCRRVKGVWQCFSGGSSYSGYGRVGFDRRIRIYDISEFGEKIVTFKKTEHNQTLHYMVLSGPGAAPPYDGPV